jgi:hypothetical protein
MYVPVILFNRSDNIVFVCPDMYNMSYNCVKNINNINIPQHETKFPRGPWNGVFDASHRV